ncbi:MAG: hypothetical protein ACPLPR_04070 [Bacillota bacterium]
MRLLIALGCIAFAAALAAWHLPCHVWVHFALSNGVVQGWVRAPLVGTVPLVKGQRKRGGRLPSARLTFSRIRSILRAAKAFLRTWHQYQRAEATLRVELSGKDPMAVSLAYGWIWVTAGVLKSQFPGLCCNVCARLLSGNQALKVDLELRVKLGPLVLAALAAAREYHREARKTISKGDKSWKRNRRAVESTRFKGL